MTALQLALMCRQAIELFREKVRQGMPIETASNEACREVAKAQIDRQIKEATKAKAATPRPRSNDVARSALTHNPFAKLGKP